MSAKITCSHSIKLLNRLKLHMFHYFRDIKLFNLISISCFISLKSGVADVRHLIDRKLKIGLGTGNSPSRN